MKIQSLVSAHTVVSEYNSLSWKLEKPPHSSELEEPKLRRSH